MSRPKSAARHPMSASEFGIDRAARLILSGRADEAIRMLRAVDGLHRSILSAPVTEFGMAAEMTRMSDSLLSLESRIDFSMEMNDRMIGYMRDAGVLQPVIDHLASKRADPEAPQPPPTN